MHDGKPLNFSLVVVPRACDDTYLWARLIQKSKDFRLGSLKESPEAFASTHERELGFDDGVWADRLRNPRATLLVAVKNPGDVDADSGVAQVRVLVETDWLATTVLVEPTGEELAKLSASQSPLHTIASPQDNAGRLPGTTSNVVFVLNGVYVAPGFRKHGLGKATLDKVFEVGQSIARSRGQRTVHFQVRVNTANTAASRLYHSAGFRETSRGELQMVGKLKDGILQDREAIIAVLDRFMSVDEE